MVNKQEEAVGETQEEETVEECVARVKAENPEMTDEAARAQCTKEPASEAEKGRLARVLRNLNDRLQKIEGKLNIPVENLTVKQQKIFDEIGKGWLQKNAAFWKELFAANEKDLRAKWDEYNIQLWKRLQEEHEEGMRKAIGLPKHGDAVVHMSDLESFRRKYQLEKESHGKRTETATTDKPTEGAEEVRKLKPAEERFKELLEKRGRNF